MNRYKCDVCKKIIDKTYYVFVSDCNRLTAIAPETLLYTCEKCAILQKLDGNLVGLSIWRNRK